MWQRRAREVIDVTARKVYATAAEAARALGCAPALVSMALSGAAPRAKGHRLAWLDELPDDAQLRATR